MKCQTDRVYIIFCLMENKRIKRYEIVTRGYSIGQVVLFFFFFVKTLYSKFQSKNKYRFRSAVFIRIWNALHRVCNSKEVSWSSLMEFGFQILQISLREGIFFPPRSPPSWINSRFRFAVYQVFHDWKSSTRITDILPIAILTNFLNLVI